MSYRQLYDFCQTQNPHIKRNLIRDKVREITGVTSISTVKTSMDTTLCRGFYLSANNTEHRLVQQCGGHVIVLARDLNRCWQRFVFTKELMHIFDDDSEKTNTPDSFEKVLVELTAYGAVNSSPQLKSEVKCFWMALGVLCPESVRKDFDRKRARGQCTDYDIALQLLIPELYVPALFDQNYYRFLEKFQLITPASSPNPLP